MEVRARPRVSAFIRYFDKTPPGIICPHFYILAHANGCIYECAYCYLQLTFRGDPRAVVFTNRDAMLAEVERFLARAEPAVLNAGELADALALESQTNLCRDVVPLFAKQDRHLLVLLTKSANVAPLLALEHNGRTVLSFSVNAPAVAARYEKGAPPVEARLAAAGQARAAGWRLRFRVDPIIPVPAWEDQYRRLMDDLLALAPERVTVGTLRYFPNVRTYARKLGRDTSVFDYAPERTAADGRFRLPFNLRVRIYEFIRDLLPAGVEFGLCKETEACHRALGITEVVCNCTF